MIVASHNAAKSNISVAENKDLNVHQWPVMKEATVQFNLVRGVSRFQAAYC